MFNIKQSTARDITIFAHDENGDAVTGLSNASFTKRIRKNGGAFAAMTVTITELENGWYEVPLTTAHTNTVGELVMTFTNAGAKQVNMLFNVSARMTDDVATQVSLNALNDVSVADVNAQCDTAISDASLATSAAITALNDVSSADVNAACDTALSDYDAPTNTEMVAAFTEIKGATWATTDTLEAIRDRGDAAWITGAGGSAPTVTQIRAEMDSNSTQLAKIDGIDTVVDAIKVKTDQFAFTVANQVDANALTGGGGGTAPTAIQIRTEMDSNSTQLAAIVADTNELQSNQGSWLTAVGFATPTDIADGDDAVLAILGTPAGADISTDIAGISAGSGLDAAATRAALGMSSANLDAQIGGIPTTAEFNSRTLAAADYFDPAADAVANVTLVGTVTTNTDMRGTDGANTTAPDNSSIADVKAKTDQLAFTKANEVDTNIKSINQVTINGNGAGTPMGV